MRFVYGQGWVHYFDETNGETDAKGTAGGAAGAAAGDGVVDGDAAGDDLDGGGAPDGEGGDKGGAAAAKEEAPKDMKAALDLGLGYKKGPNGEQLDPLTGKAKAAPAAKDDIKAAKTEAGAAKDTETHWANGKPKKDAQGNELDDRGAIAKKAAPAKAKTSAELNLKPEELKALAPKTQQRFGEMITTLKAHEGTINTLTTENKTLKEGRDTILGLMQEARCSDDDLAGYLYLNQLLTSNEPKDLELALSEIEKQRIELYARLGREPEGGGVDLLAHFPDLVKQVEDEEITRKAALEIAHARREKAARSANENREKQQQQSKKQTAEQAKKASDEALTSIDAWVAGLAKSDIDYKAKEDKLLAKVDEVIQNYPPAQWLPTLKLLYQGIEIQKAPSGGRQHQPLRPSGAKVGGKAPADMKEAIDQALGYATAASG